MNLTVQWMTGLGVALLVSGCGGSRSHARVDFSKMGPSLNSKRYANLEKLAAKDLKCDAELSPTYLGENQYEMSGCGAAGTYELRCLMGQCSWVPDVKARAEFDLGCARAELAATRLDKHTAGVTGCGKRATYRLLGSRYSLSWVLNSQVSQDEAPPPPAPESTGDAAPY